jgi:hypothetical protein
MFPKSMAGFLITNCVAGINRYTVPIGVLYAKKMMSKKRFIRDPLP